MSNIEVYYCKQTAAPTLSNRVSPAPLISINPEIYYSNDTPIGYTYTVTLSGYANALRKELNNGSANTGIEYTIDHIGDLRNIFNFNGGNLYIKQNNQNILVAKGATIKDISFDESDNRWVNYAPFTITIEFNEIDLLGCNNFSIGCDSSFFHTPNQSENAFANDNLVDITKYKIKAFTDKWSFVIDNQIYQNYSSVSNGLFKVTYTLSATGKNYYVDDKLIPAWQQAKLFVQDRLYTQVQGLMGGIAQIETNNIDGCGATKTQTELFAVDNQSKTSGILASFVTAKDGIANYDIYNETVSCDTSESDGTFSITYNATIKKYDPSLSSNENAVLHTYTSNLSISDGSPQTVSLTAQGNIQGLIRGGFIYYNNDFVLPKNGTFISTIDSSETKYSNALAYYNSKVGTTTDLLDDTKDLMNVKKSQLLIQGEDGYPLPSSFTLDHNYHEGNIAYNATYDKALAQTLGRGYSNISIVRNDPTEIVQEFVVPGRAAGPIIQKLNMKTARTITINIEGADTNNRGCFSLENLDLCNLLPNFNIANFNYLIEDNPNWIKTKEDYNSNKHDGSYTISIEYTCKG